MFKIKNIARRIEKIEEQIQATEPYTIVLSIYDTTTNKYKISSPNFNREEQEYDKLEDYIKEHNINIDSKKTILLNLSVAPNRTYDDVMNS